MERRSTCKLSNILTGLTVLCWAAAVAVAALDWDGTASGRALSAFGFAAAMTVITQITNVRQTTARATGILVAAVAAAPRDSYYRGYGDAAQDALGTNDDPGEPEL